MKIEGSVAAVTGASGGIGREIARALRDGGADLVVVGRRVPALEAVASEVGGGRVEACDFTRRDEVLDLASRLTDVDIIVANAALPGTGRLVDFTPEEVDRVLAVNLAAPMMLAQRLLPRMLERGRGHLVFISSMGGKIPAHQLSIYAASKYGLRGFAGCLRQDLAGTGVGVSVVFPGSVVDAGMLADAGLGAAPGTKGVSAVEVAAAVVDAIEKNRGEIDVAPRLVRTVAKAAALFPSLLDKIASRQESQDYADELTAGLRHLR